MKSLRKLAALAALSTIGLAVQPAFAGTWSFTVEGEGQKQANGGTSFQWKHSVGSPPNPFVWYERDITFSTPHGSSTGAGYSAGNINLICTWTPSGPTDQLADGSFRIESNALINAIVSTTPSTNVTSTADNGVGDPVVHTSEIMGGNVDLSDRSKYLRRYTASSGYLNPNGSLRWEIPLSILAQLSANGGVTATVSASAFASIDARKLSLTRTVARTPLREGVDTIDPNRDEWVAKDGTGHGHTLTSYKVRSLIANQIIDNDLDVTNTINASRSGPWSSVSQLQYKWTPDITDNYPVGPPDYSTFESKVTSQTRDAQTRQMIRSNAVKNPDGVVSNPDLSQILTTPFVEDPNAAGWINLASNKKGAVLNHSYELTDLADNVKAKANYELMLHDEWESPTPDETKFWIDASNTAQYGETLSQWRCKPLGLAGTTFPTTNNNQSEWDVSVSGDVSFSLNSSFGTDFKLKDWLNFGFNAETSAKVNVNATFKALALKPAVLFPGADTTVSYQPVIKYKYITKHQVFNKFGVSGWIPNPARQNAPIPGPFTLPNDGKWPKAKEDRLVQVEPSWLKVDGDHGPINTDQDYPIYPTPTPTPEPENLTVPPPSSSSS